ncbi:MAG: hypothetical protein MK202_02265 [Tenacibaculum sp.]|nr:hypothetical protein [Tenacibaculum sp.]
MKKLLFLTVVILMSCYNHQKFDSELWKKSGGENITSDIRLKMVKDLIESKVLIHKSEFEIIEIIGSPTKLKEIQNDSTKYFQVQEVYSWNIDPDYMTFLKIIFNKDKTAKKVEFHNPNQE